MYIIAMLEKSILVLFLFFQSSYSFPEQGKWDFEMSGSSGEDQTIVVTKSLFNGSKIFVNIICDTPSINEDNIVLNVTWYLRKATCWKEYFEADSIERKVEEVFQILTHDGLQNVNESAVYVYASELHPCDDKNYYLSTTKTNMEVASDIKAYAEQKEAFAIMNREKKIKKLQSIMVDRKRRESDISLGLPAMLGSAQLSLPPRSGAASKKPLFIVPADGIYQFALGTKILTEKNPNFISNISYKAMIHIEMVSDYGYLSAADYPLLIFYSALCVIYVIYGVGWLIVSFMRWRELLRVQYWIGAVILLGMLEKAVFTAEYESVNKRGVSVPGLIVFAELVSCAKRTLSRMLVIIVSFGFGIVKPRLGIVLHRVVGIGILYFILASIEGCMRALKPKLPNDEYSRRLLFAIIPLALLESAICWWVFSALVSTTRTLRLRRNVIKLNLFRHFTNTLIFAVGTSVIFMLWSIKYRNFDSCLSDWKQLWVNDAFWHVLFAIILLVIMILWRPTNNNQRFAFSPLLDEGSEGEEDEQEKLMTNISDSMKFRNQKSSASSSPRNSHSVDDDLKWMEENIPSMTDTGFPVMDSEEELVNTKFEISKMQ